MLLALGTIALRWATLGSVAFVVLFGILAPWRRSAMGRAVMTFMSVIMALLLYINIAPLLGELGRTTRLWVRLCSFAALGVPIWWHVWLLVTAQLDNLRRRRREGNSRIS